MFDTYYDFRLINAEDSKGELFNILKRYTFIGPENQRYIIRVESFSGNLYGIKFYLKSHSDSEKKYTLLTGFQSAPKIIRTCIEVILSILKDDTKASFCFLGTRLETELAGESKRFRVYKGVMENFFAPINFEHHILLDKNLYFILNKANNIATVHKNIQKLISQYHFED